MGAKEHMAFEELDATTDLAALAAGRSYFFVEFHDGSRIVHWIASAERHSLQFGRMVLANLIKHPARVDWKACVGSKAEEEATASEFKKAFKPFEVVQ
jgi:hypothetical protein